MPRLPTRTMPGGDRNVFVDDNGVWMSGDGTYGAIGNGVGDVSYSSPVLIPGSDVFKRISTGKNHSAALDFTGRAWCWGLNDYGNLGNNDQAPTGGTWTPVEVVGEHSFVDIAAATRYTMGLKDNGEAWAWGGNNGYGTLGTNNLASYSSPVAVVGGHSFVAISLRCYIATALKADGSVWTWGNNQYGGLGVNDTNNRSSPTAVVGVHSFVQICAGNGPDSGGFATAGYVLALKENGQAWAWGANNAGQLGTGDRTSYSSPVQVIGAHSFIGVVAGPMVSAGLKENGEVWVWGINTYGQLGIGTADSYSSPVRVIGSFTFVDVQIGGSGDGGQSGFMSGMLSTGIAFSWGSNSSGQLGDLTTTARSSPVLVDNNKSWQHFYKRLRKLIGSTAPLPTFYVP